MNKLKRGLAEGITGIILGILLITIVNSFVEDGLLPDYFVWLFGLLSLIANIATINSLRYTGLLYAIGWLIGSMLLIDLLGVVEIIFNIASPIVILILRVWFLIKNTLR